MTLSAAMAGHARVRRLKAARRGARLGAASARGQVAVLVVGGLLAVALGALVLGAVAKGLGTRDAAQRAADLAALGGARAMHDAYDRLFEPAFLGGRPNPRHLDREAYLALGRAAAVRVAAANGAPGADVRFPDGATFAPVRIRVAVERHVAIASETVRMKADARRRSSPRRPASGRRRSARAGDTTARSRTGRASRCGRTSRSRSTGWRPRPARTGSTW